jgi:hypothetical protein
MISLKKTLLALAMLGATHLEAGATLLHPVEFSGASQTWLVLSETEGLSINDILNGVGGWNTKYRFATQVEVLGLLAERNVVAHDYSSTLQYGDFVRNVGGTDHQSGMEGTYWGGDGSQGAAGRTFDLAINVLLTSGDNNDPLSPDCGAYTNCTLSTLSFDQQNLDARNDAVGNFLVRANQVPEPGSIALLGLAGALLAARRRLRATSL